jgi:RNA polymerase-associated protein CTR9
VTSASSWPTDTCGRRVTSAGARARARVSRGAHAQANKVDGAEQLPWLARGHLALARNNLEEAAKSFQAASERRDNGADSIAPTLGAACCAFHRGALQEALRLYGRALRRHPSGPARLGLGATLLRLGHPARARAAFERAVSLDPACAEAHLGVALCVAAQHGDAAAALPALRAAYDANPHLSPVLLLLSEHATLGAHGAAAEALARAGAEAAEAAQLRGAASLQLGRLAHAAGRASDAAKQYNAALVSAPADMTPHFGLGQVALARDELHSATAHFERVASTATGGACTRRALGHLYASAPDAERRQRAMELLRAAAEADPLDAGAAVELAELMRRGPLPEALAQYEKALAAQRASGQPHSLTLLNNAGVLAAAVAGEQGLRVARRHYAAALQACGAGWLVDLSNAPDAPDGALLQGLSAVVAFNWACLEDDSGDRKFAASLFARLRRDCPAEVEVLLRHVLLAMTHGDLAAAEQMASDAHAAAPRNPDAVALLGGLAIARCDFKGAQVLLDTFRKGPTSVGGRPGAQAFAYDEYIMVCAANALLADARRDSGARAGRSDAPDHEAAARRENRLERALALYSKALARAPGNAYAANGVGAVLAERGRLEEAGGVFTSVAEAAVGSETLSALAHASLVNSAHCQLGLGAPGRAVRLYEQALRRSGGGATDAGVLLCNARALHDWKGEGENHLRAARAALLRALHLTPGDHRARFDVAFVCQEQAVRLLARFREQTPGSEGRLASADAACDELHLAGRFFRQLLALGEAAAHGFDARRTHIHAAFCADALVKATSARAQATRELEASQARRTAQELERAAAEEHQRRLADAHDAAEAVRLAKLEERANAAKSKLDQAQQRWATVEVEAADKRRAAAPGKSKDGKARASEARGDASADEADAEMQAEQADDAAGAEGAAGEQEAPAPQPPGASEEPGAAAGEAPQGEQVQVKAPRRLKQARGAGDDGGAAAKRALAELEEEDEAREGAPKRKRRAKAISDDDA